MSKMANKSVIGAFVIGAIALAVIAVIIFGSGKFFRKQQEYVMFFEGSVKGLSIGSPVIFRGVKIGEVKDISMRLRAADLSFFIPVIVEIDPERIQQEEGAKRAKPYQHFQTLIDKGLRAQLQSQSFVTGQLAVALDFFPDKPAKLVGLEKKYHEIPTVPTTLEDLEKSLKDIDFKGMIEKLRSTMEGIERTVNSPEIQKTLKSVSESAEETRVMIKTVSSQVTPVAANASATMQDIQKLVQNLDRQITTLLPTAEATMKDAQKLVQNVDSRIGPVASNAEEALKGINNLVNQDVKNLVGNLDRGIAQMMPEIVRNLEALQGTLQEAQAALRSVGGSAGSTSPVIYQLTKTLEEVSNAARSLRSLTDYIEQHPEALLRGK